MRLLLSSLIALVLVPAAFAAGPRVQKISGTVSANSGASLTVTSGDRSLTCRVLGDKAQAALVRWGVGVKAAMSCKRDGDRLLLKRLSRLDSNEGKDAKNDDGNDGTGTTATRTETRPTTRPTRRATPPRAATSRRPACHHCDVPNGTSAASAAAEQRPARRTRHRHGALLGQRDRQARRGRRLAPLPDHTGRRLDGSRRQALPRSPRRHRLPARRRRLRALGHDARQLAPTPQHARRATGRRSPTGARSAVVGPAHLRNAQENVEIATHSVNYSR